MVCFLVEEKENVGWLVHFFSLSSEITMPVQEVEQMQSFRQSIGVKEEDSQVEDFRDREVRRERNSVSGVTPPV